MSKQTSITAIDIGSSKITTLIITPSLETGKLNVVGVATSPSRGIKKSQVVDIEEAIRSITSSVEAAERMAGFSINSAYVSVSGEHIDSQNSKGVVAIGNPEGEIVQDDIYRVIEAARAVSLPSSREILHVIPSEFIVDSQAGVRDPLGMSGVRLEAETHLITGSTAVMKNLSRCVSDLGINIDGLVFSGLASAEATLTDTEKELGVILIDIGGGTSSVVAYVDGAIGHSTVIPVGAKNIANDLAIGLRISLDSAEKIKTYLTRLEKNPPQPNEAEEETRDKKRRDDHINLSRLNLKEEIRNTSKKTLVDGIIRPRLNEIFNLVGASIRQAGLAGKTPAGVVITGGGAETVAVTDACRRTLQLPVRIGEPNGLAGLVEEVNSPAYSTATGLILYAVSQPDSGANFSSNFSDLLKNLPGKGLVSKGSSWIKSLLP